MNTYMMLSTGLDWVDVPEVISTDREAISFAMGFQAGIEDTGDTSAYGIIKIIVCKDYDEDNLIRTVYDEENSTLEEAYLETSLKLQD